MNRGLYLHDVPLPEARERLQQALQQAGLWGPLGAEAVTLPEALGRITAEPVWARLSSPNVTSAAMDGYAIRAQATQQASDRSPVELNLGTQAGYVDTGDPLPLWSDAVAPIEVVEVVEGRVRLRAPIAPWSNLRPVAEDLAAGDLVLASGHRLRPVDLGALASSGIATLRVWRRPRVAILPTGDELVPVEQSPRPGEIIESNSLVLAAQVQAWGGLATRLPIVPDDFALLRQAVLEASAGQDLVLINAGSSAGSEDFTAQVVESIGRVLVHGVAVRPGHPVILGMIESQGRVVPAIGVPGFPVSAALTGEIFVEPLLARWSGAAPHNPPRLLATLTRKVHSSAGDDEYLRVAVGRVGDRVVAAPLPRGAGMITSLVRADGIVLIPAGAQGLEAGDAVEVRLYLDPALVDRTLVALGSHDLTLDLLAERLPARQRRLTSANVGSLGGLIALSRHEAHFGGCHLLDPETGEYNLPYVRRYLPGRKVILLGFVRRTQGLILPYRNPKGLAGVADLCRPDITFVNRQRGAGTRLLLDHLLGQARIDSASIRGYTQETYTHLAVAASIAAGQADCGMGVEAAAAQFGLDFLPLAEERYDLVVPEEHYSSSLFQPVLEVLADAGLQAAIGALPGYALPEIGKVLHVIEP
ncbi:MAG: molybdopterin biosynthesis protein [Anaerolineales bacterium]|nr:molybdopterin biosynthesis protein [Anaerolineales bacterium]